MATTLALAMRASMSATGVVSGANQAADAMDKMGRQARRTAGDMSGIRDVAIGATIANGVSALANTFVSAGQAALGYARGVINAVDAMNDLASRVGMGVESLQALQMAAKLSGVNDVTTAVQKLTVAIGNAGESGNTEAFTRLGLSFAELQAMSPEEQFRAVQAAISALATPAEQAAAAVAIFGRSGVELLPLMSQNLAEVEERMRRLGAVVGADQVEGIGEMNDALDMVQMTFDGIVGNVAGNLAPIVTSLAEEFMSFVESFNSVSGSGGEGIANVLTDALLDVADYLAGVFDNVLAGFDGFSVTMGEIAAVFELVGNVFTAVSESLRIVFNIFELAGNALMLGLGKFLEGIGSWVSSDLQKFGAGLAETAQANADKNTQEINQAASNVAGAATAAVFGSPASPAADGPASRAVDAARQRMTPDERQRRQQERDAKQAEQKAAREAAAAEDKAQREAKAAADKAAKEAEEERKRQEKIAKDAADVTAKITGKEEQLSAAQADKAAAIEGVNDQSLKATDVRSSEGMSEFVRLATGRQDPAVEENRKANLKLEEIRKELRALQTQRAEILGAA
jgi:hypothetical protein